ncbi:MAG: hypothetical protein QG673_1254, partial [Pseudomonadota bacterium]|nr:hypothetical protein [Pseudomonadota bacterium]
YDNGNSFVPFNSNDGYGSNVLDVFANQNDVLVGTNKGIGVYIE